VQIFVLDFFVLLLSEAVIVLDRLRDCFIPLKSARYSGGDF